MLEFDVDDVAKTMTWQTCGSNGQTWTWQLRWQKLTMWQLVEQSLTGVAMTCRWRVDDVSDDVDPRGWRGRWHGRVNYILSWVFFFSLSFFLASLASVTRCRRCRRWLTPCSCLGQRREGKRWCWSGVAAGRGCWSGVAAGRGLLPKVRALWMVGRGWCCCWGAVDGADG